MMIKINRKKEKRQKNLSNFFIPLLNKLSKRLARKVIKFFMSSIVIISINKSIYLSKAANH